MFRNLRIASVLVMIGLASGCHKNDAGKDSSPQSATISKMDAKNRTITVHVKDKNGKEVDKTFKLAEDVRYVDSTGKTAAIDVFQSGDEVVILEAEGRVKEIRRGAAGRRPPPPTPKPTPATPARGIRNS